ncbi:MAG: ABC transporter substrate-binding protein [Bryobacterales bacterium]|nr:ABC transporter substrate-binding protein [Bryobacterales bacterium]
MRIVSLLPSGTEVVAALGLARQMVARSHACDYPAEIVHLPPCTIPARGTSGANLQQDSLRLPESQRALSVFQVDWDLLRAMRPTHVVTQTLCRQCAVSAEEVRDSLKEELSAGTELICFEALSLDGVVQEIRQAGNSLGCPQAGDALANRMLSRFAASRERESAKPRDHKPLVACLDWLEPPMLAGNWMPELIRLAGGRPAGGGDGVHSGWMQWEELVAADPDLVIAIPCGYTLGQSKDGLLRLNRRSEWKELRAVRNGEVYAADGSQFFNRPGPRLVESLEILEEILGTANREPAHRGVHWFHAPLSAATEIAS